MTFSKFFKDFNIAALPSKAITTFYAGMHAVLSEQYLFEKKNCPNSDILKEMSKAQYVRGRMADNLYRKLHMGDIDSRPIMYAAMNLVENTAPHLMRMAIKASANPVLMGAFIITAGLLTDETTRSMITEQVTNLASLFSTQVHEVEDQMTNDITKPNSPAPS